MGFMYTLQCANCGNRYNVPSGPQIGMSWPSVQEEILEDVRSGKYGFHLQRLAQSDRKFRIDCKPYAYLCDSCGYWTCSPIFDVYDLKATNNRKPSDTLNYELNDMRRYFHRPGDCVDRGATSSLSDDTSSPDSSSLASSNPAGEHNIDTHETDTCISFPGLTGGNHLFKATPHYCIECGATMHLATDEQSKKFKCPQCGGAPVTGIVGKLCWD